MGWCEPDPVGERGFETSYRSTVTPSLVARLVFDCHAEPRRLEVTLPEAGFPDRVLAHLRPLGRPFVVGPGLALLDRAGYFRINLVPSRLQALVRKEAPLSVIAELIALLEAAHGGPRLQAADCPVAALTYVDGRLQIDDRGCTACLDCVRPAVRAEYLPPSRLIDDPRQPAQAAGPQGAG